MQRFFPLHPLGHFQSFPGDARQGGARGLISPGDDRGSVERVKGSLPAGPRAMSVCSVFQIYEGYRLRAIFLDTSPLIS